MAYKLVCADSGAKCPFEVVSATRDEVMEHAKMHAKMAHPEMASNPPSPEMMNKLVRQV
jgi:predicted small metal-binding protein